MDWPDWRVTAPLSAVLVIGVVLSRGVRTPWSVGIRAFCRELALVLLLYSIWQYGNVFNGTEVDRALDNGRWVADVQRWVHLPSEAWLQRLFLPHPLWVQAMNGYYAIFHAPAMGVVLFWLYFAHRDRYPAMRNTLALVTGACLLIQIVPVAPPRLLPGYVDTGLLYEQSVYGRGTGGLSDQISAMPSVHAAWALLVAVAVITVSRSRWRWAVLAHPVLTVLAITVTANHWWLDSIVSGVLLALSIAVVSVAARVAIRLQRGARDPSEPEDRELEPALTS